VSRLRSRQRPGCDGRRRATASATWCHTLTKRSGFPGGSAAAENRDKFDGSGVDQVPGRDEPAGDREFGNMGCAHDRSKRAEGQ
jgi:hypothetical protein